MKRTKTDMKRVTRRGLQFTIPAGSPVDPATGRPGVYWVKPEVFPEKSIERHDATYYGVCVEEDDLIED